MLLDCHGGGGRAQRGWGCCSTDKGWRHYSAAMAEVAELKDDDGNARPANDGDAARLPWRSAR
jgi:hypothetical protein